MVIRFAHHSYKGVGTLLYVFGTSYNALTIYNSLRMRRIERGMKVVKNGTIIASTLLFLLSVTAFIAYLPHHGGADPSIGERSGGERSVP